MPNLNQSYFNSSLDPRSLPSLRCPEFSYRCQDSPRLLMWTLLGVNTELSPLSRILIESEKEFLDSTSPVLGISGSFTGPG